MTEMHLIERLGGYKAAKAEGEKWGLSDLQQMKKSKQGDDYEKCISYI